MRANLTSVFIIRGNRTHKRTSEAQAKERDLRGTQTAHTLTLELQPLNL